jgi:anaerobic selenocysteine-containing dehydrogenase
VPGEDAAVLAGMLRIILAEGLADVEFCARHVDGLERLRAAVEPFTPDAVAARAGVPADLLREAARVFGGAGKRGCAGAATGLTMSPHSNLVDHLVETLNVVCGRYVRAGETLANSGPLSPPAPRHAEVVPPQRPWERGYRSRAGGFGMIPGIAPGGEVPVGILADEILLPGEGQVRCLFVEGGNPAVAVPDQARAVEALASLELLVAVEPFMSATARLAHYIIPPKLMYERPDVPMLFGSQLRLPVSFSQYAPALVEPPPDAQVIDDWYLYWSLAKRLGLTIEGPGGPLAGDAPPTTDELIAGMLATAQVPLDELARHPHGKVFDDLDPVVVQPARPDSDARFAVLPDDVAEELRAYREAVADPAYPYRLTVRRMRHIMNSLDPSTPTPDENPAFLNPADMRRLGLNDGDPLEIVSDHARVTAIAETDERLRPGVVSISHCYGGLPGETVAGTCTNLLVDSRRHHQDINAMPTMSGLPVRLAPARVSGSATPAGACP